MASPAYSFADLTTSVLISIRRTARPDCVWDATVNVFAETEDIFQSTTSLLPSVVERSICVSRAETILASMDTYCQC